MAYDNSKDPLAFQKGASTGLGRSGRLVTPHDVNDLAVYAPIRVWAPSALASAAIVILPVGSADPITLSIPVGLVTVPEYIVRRVLDTGTTATLVIHTVEP